MTSYLGPISDGRTACLIPKELANGSEASSECALTVRTNLRTSNATCLELEIQFLTFFLSFLPISCLLSPSFLANFFYIFLQFLAFFLRCFNSSWTSAHAVWILAVWICSWEAFQDQGWLTRLMIFNDMGEESVEQCAKCRSSKRLRTSKDSPDLTYKCHDVIMMSQGLLLFHQNQDVSWMIKS